MYFDVLCRHQELRSMGIIISMYHLELTPESYKLLLTSLDSDLEL